MEICDQCKKSICREIASKKGRLVNCVAYGCDNHGKYSQCRREDQIRYCLDKIEKDNPKAFKPE